jgi:hypothetical protein
MCASTAKFTAAPKRRTNHARHARPFGAHNHGKLGTFPPLGRRSKPSSPDSAKGEPTRTAPCHFVPLGEQVASAHVDVSVNAAECPSGHQADYASTLRDRLSLSASDRPRMLEGRVPHAGFGLPGRFPRDPACDRVGSKPLGRMIATSQEEVR